MKYLKWFGRAVRPYRGSIAAMMACHVLLAACSIGFVYVSKMLVDVAVDLLGGHSAVRGLTFWATAMVGIVVLRIFLNAIRSFLQTRTEIRLKNRLRSRLFHILLHVENDGGARRHSGDVINRLQEDVKLVSGAFAVSVPDAFGAGLHFLAALVYLMTLEPRLGLVILVVVPSCVLAGKFIGRRMRNLTHDIRRTSAKVQSHMQESVQHAVILQTMEYADNSSSVLENLQNELYGNEVRRVRFTVFSRIFLALAFQAGHATAFLWGVWGISTGVVTYGMMTAFLQLVGQIQRPLAEMTNRIPSIIHATASIDRLEEIEALPTEYVEEPVFIDGPLGIKLEDVDFSYPEVQVLKDFSHDFIPGSRTAVVGPTGVGKTTMVRLLLSLLKPSKGSISIYSSAASAPVSSSTRCNLVYVPQGNSLFSGTIRENLHIGDPDATDEKMIHALHTAAADFVFDLPSGLDTQCFEAGAGLSEGQAQRIAVARALLRPGSILLLDEFSSALDADTENLLMERLTASLPSHTMIFITHREKIIDYCDSILRL